MEVLQINLKDIVLKRNIRTKDYEDVASLMQSIKSEGLLQPVGVKYLSAKKKYELIYGNRRFMAVKKLGYVDIPCVVLEGNGTSDEKDFILKNISENSNRQSINIYDLGLAAKALHEEHNMSLQEIGVRFGMTKLQVKTAISCISVIPEEMREDVVDKKHGNGKGVENAGKIGNHAISMITSLKRKYDLPPQDIKDLLLRIKREALNTYQINNIAALMSQGMTLDKAVKEEKNITSIRSTIVVDKKELEIVKKKFGTTWLKKILTGEVEYKFKKIV